MIFIHIHELYLYINTDIIKTSYALSNEICCAKSSFEVLFKKKILYNFYFYIHALNYVFVS